MQSRCETIGTKFRYKYETLGEEDRDRQRESERERVREIQGNEPMKVFEENPFQVPSTEFLLFGH